MFSNSIRLVRYGKKNRVSKWKSFLISWELELDKFHLKNIDFHFSFNLKSAEIATEDKIESFHRFSFRILSIQQDWGQLFCENFEGKIWSL